MERECVGGAKERETCEVEKLGCEGCYYYREKDGEEKDDGEIDRENIV